MSDNPNPRAGAADEIHAPAWTALRYFNFYRALLAGLLLALVLWGVAPRAIGQYDFGLFRATTYAYFVFSVLVAVTGKRRWPAFEIQVFVQVVADIVALTLLMHASGGIPSGFGTLLVVAIAGGSILIQGRIAVLFAALGSLAVLAQQLYIRINDPFVEANYPHAGMLGAALFATVFLVQFSVRRMRASEALARRRQVDLANLAQLNEHIVGRMQSGIVAVDGAGRLRLINDSARHLLGLGSRRVADLALATISPDLDALLALWRDDRYWTSRLFQPHGGSLKLMAAFGAIGADPDDGVLVFLEDASAMQQRAQKLKLSALGRLAGSIAHEIRNPLGAVSHAAQLLAEAPELCAADRRLTGIICDNSQRMNTIVENVLQLSRGKLAQPEEISLAEWLNDFADEFSATTGSPRAALAVTVAPPELRVRFDPDQLRQVLVNLCENGIRYAGSPPLVRLKAGFGAADERPYLEVSDNGAGVPEASRDRLFEPFFTTRPQGAGLGLYISRELCEGNRAALNYVASAAATSSGGCFRITFAHPRRQAEVVM